MNLQDFNSLDDAQKELILKQMEDDSKRIQDLEAERDSFKNENDKITAEYVKLSDENKKTKELNFTLGRRLSLEGERASAEDILNDMLNERRNKK